MNGTDGAWKDYVEIGHLFVVPETQAFHWSCYGRSLKPVLEHFEKPDDIRGFDALADDVKVRLQKDWRRGRISILDNEHAPSLEKAKVFKADTANVWVCAKEIRCKSTTCVFAKKEAGESNSHEGNECGLESQSFDMRLGTTSYQRALFFILSTTS